MNTLQQVTLVQYRNYGARTFHFPAPVTCITGPNGSGKTNLLDAVYYLCYTKSYFTSTQALNARFGTDGFRLEGHFEGARRETIVCKWQGGRKEVMADGVPYDRTADHIGKYAAVMVAPDDLELINGGAEVRRRWVDSILGQTDREYLDRLGHYNRVLQQRAAWLRTEQISPGADRIALEFYDAQLAEHGTCLHDRRAVFLDAFMPLLHPYYIELSGGREAVTIHHEADLYRRPMKQWLRTGLATDLRAGRTLHGPHRDDWDFRLDGAGAKAFASQGQKKSFLFALKLAQYAYLREALGHLPILLLDDVFEKLDAARISALLRIIRGPGFGQVLLTDTHAERVEEAFGGGVGVSCIGLLGEGAV